MSTERVVTDNELICDFMGLKHRKEFGPLTGEEYTSVKQTNNANWLICHYETSWDWLMPVVEKIESVGFEFNICLNSALVMNNLKGISEPITLAKLPADKRFEYVSSGTTQTKIQCTYLTCLEFIKWYNSNGPIKENSPEDGVRKHE